MDSNHRIERGATSLLSMDELNRELSELEAGAFISLTDIELGEKIRQIHDGFRVTAPTSPAGMALYRAVKVSQLPLHRNRVSFAPSTVVKINGRLNRSGESMFYSSSHFFTSLQECDCQVGDFFAISGWLLKEPMTFNHLGFSASVISEPNTKRELPFFAQTPESSVRNALIRQWQGRVFTKAVQKGEEHLYRLPIALRDFALGKMIQTDCTRPAIFSGIIYPSVAMQLSGDNFAILPSEVDKKLALFEVILLTLSSTKAVSKDDGSTETSFNIQAYDYARPDCDGNLVWGQKSQVIYSPEVDASKIEPRLLRPE